MKGNFNSLSTGQILGNLRKLLLGLVVIGLLGVGVDLVLLRHYEDVWQALPLVLIGLALAAIIWHVIHRTATSVRIVQVVMALSVVSGIIGLILHYRASMEFQMEMGVTGWPLFWKTIHAKAPPALAPAAMIHIGLLGLLYTWRHVAFNRPSLTSPVTSTTQQASISS